MDCVFSDPIHSNGGCIFANPSVIIVTPTPGGGGGFTYPPRRRKPHIVDIEPDKKLLEQNNLALILLSAIY